MKSTNTKCPLCGEEPRIIHSDLGPPEIWDKYGCSCCCYNLYWNDGYEGAKARWKHWQYVQEVCAGNKILLEVYKTLSHATVASEHVPAFVKCLKLGVRPPFSEKELKFFQWCRRDPHDTSIEEDFMRLPVAGDKCAP